MATNQKKNELKNNGRRKISSNGGGGIIVLGGALLTAAISAAVVSHIARRNTKTKSKKHKINNKEMGLHSLLPSADQSEKLGVEEPEIQVTSSKDYEITEEIREIEDSCKLSEIITERALESDISNSQAIEARESESCIEESDASHLGDVEQSTSIAEISRKEMDSTEINMQDNETTENLVKLTEAEKNANEEEMKSHVDGEENEIDGEEIVPTELVETETDLVPIQANDFSNSQGIKTKESELCEVESVVEGSNVSHLEGEVEQPTSIAEIQRKETYSTKINMPDNEAIENLAKAAEAAENANEDEMKSHGDDEEREIDSEEVCPTELAEIETNLVPIQGNNFNNYEMIDARENEAFNAENVVEESDISHLKEVELPTSIAEIPRNEIESREINMPDNEATEISVKSAKEEENTKEEEMKSDVDLESEIDSQEVCPSELVKIETYLVPIQGNDFNNAEVIETRESESYNAESVVEESDVSHLDKEVEQPTSIAEILRQEINMLDNEATENLVKSVKEEENVKEEEMRSHVDDDESEIDSEKVCPIELVEIETDLLPIQGNDFSNSEVIETTKCESYNAESVVEESDVSHLDKEVELPTSIVEIPRKEIYMLDNEATENLVKSAKEEENAKEEEMRSHVDDDESKIDSEKVCPTELVETETDLLPIQNIKLETEDNGKASLVKEKEEPNTESKLEETTSDSFMEMNAEAIYKLSSTEKEMKLESETMGKTNDILKTKSDTMVACKESRKDFMLIGSPKAFLMVLALALFAGLLALFHHEQIGQHNNSLPKIYHQLYQLLFRSYN